VKRLRSLGVVLAGFLWMSCSAVTVPAGERDGLGRAASRRVLVTLDPASAGAWRAVAKEMAAVDGVRLVASWFLASLGEQCLVVEAPADVGGEEAAHRLARWPRVSGASAVKRYRVLATSSPDPYAHLQRFASLIRLDQAHRRATGAGVTVAIVDTGIDVEHPDLAGSVTQANDFVGRGTGFTVDVHGTAVAGVVAARMDNGIGVSGVAPQASLWALKACWQEPPGGVAAVCDSYTLAQALDAAIVGGTRVLNLSLEGPPDELVERLILAALRRNVTVVAAAEGEPAGFPASVPGVVAAYAWSGESSVREEEQRLPADALVAPAVDVLTTVPRGGYDFFSGSSFAAAQASGVAALVLELRPELSPSEVSALLIDSARPMADPGSGQSLRLLDACNAVASAARSGVCDAAATGGRP